MNLRGVFPPITTPFSDDELSIDIPALKRNAGRWMTTGLRGLVVLGSNGEAPLVDEAESDAAIDAVRACVPTDRVLIAGTGRESTKGAIDASLRAAKLGADAVLVRTPSYFKPQLTPAAFVDHYTAVADASPVPVLLYNFSALTGVTLVPDVVATLAAHPNIVGMKESGSDLGYVSALVDTTPDDFALLVGSAPTFYPSLLCGATGGIMALACVAPDECVELFELVSANALEEARALQRRLTPLAKLVTRVHGVPGLKAALDLLGFTGGHARPPFRPLSPDAVDELRRALTALDLDVSSGTRVAQLRS